MNLWRRIQRVNYYLLNTTDSLRSYCLNVSVAATLKRLLQNLKIITNANVMCASHQRHHVNRYYKKCRLYSALFYFVFYFAGTPNCFIEIVVIENF